MKSYDKKGNSGEDDQRELSEDIIRHILSFLSTKEAARMNLVSKTWYSVWSTHPILYIALDDFVFKKTWNATIKEIGEEFINHANQSIQRYRNHNLCIQQLHISMNCCCYPGLSYLIEKLLNKVEEEADLVKELRVSYTTTAGRGVAKRVLPDLFSIFEAKALTELSFTGCEVKQKIGNKEIKCCLLRKLCLEHVRMEDATLQSIISSCPLIENLELVFCRGLKRVKVSNLGRLKEFSVSNSDCPPDPIEFEVEAPSLESCDFWGWLRFELNRCQNLKTLSLYCLPIEESYFEDLGNRFPGLLDLSVDYCFGFERMNIFSNSLKSISLRGLNSFFTKRKEIEINAPALVSIVYEGYHIPHFNFLAIPSSKYCECNLRIDSNIILSNGSWFLELKKALKKLNNFKISLFVSLFLMAAEAADEEKINFQSCGKPGVQVEDLRIDLSSSSYPRYSTLVDNVFWTCRPKTIWINFKWDSNNEFIKVLCQRLMCRRDEWNSRENQYWENDLMYVKIEMVKLEGEKDGQLVPVDWRILLDSYSALFWSSKKIFFRLKWLTASSLQSWEAEF